MTSPATSSAAGAGSDAVAPATEKVRVYRHQEWQPKAELFQFMDEGMKNPSGGLAIGFRYDGAKLRVKTPKLRLPFGLQTGMDGKGYNLSLAFNETEAGQAFLKQCERFDEIIEQAGIAHPETWFAKGKTGKAPSEAVIKDRFYPMIKPASNERYQPTFKIKLPSKKVTVADPDNPAAVEGKVEIDAFQCRLFDKDKNPLSIDDDTLCGGSHVSVLMSCSTVWSTTTGFGATWKAEQIMVFPSANGQLPDHCLLDGDSEDSDADETKPGDVSEEVEVSAAPKQTAAPAVKPAVQNEQVRSTPSEAAATTTQVAQAVAPVAPVEEGDEEFDVEEEVVKKPVARAKRAPVKK